MDLFGDIDHERRIRRLEAMVGALTVVALGEPMTDTMRENLTKSVIDISELMTATVEREQRNG